MRIGTIGTGPIVRTILREAAGLPGISYGAVYSRKEETGRALADEFGIGTVYTSIEDLVGDPGIDTIYIASPNSLHVEQAALALRHGKNVLLEKPFAPTLRQARELFAMADERGLYLLEAISTLSMPNYRLLKEHIGDVGNVRLVQCSYCQYSSRYDLLLAGEEPNIFSPRFAGGALMDINVYNVWFVVGLFGRPLEVSYHANLHSNGIDTSGVLLMRYDGFQCVCTGAKDTWGVDYAQIQGESGFAYMTDGAHKCSSLRIVQKGGDAVPGTDEEGGVRCMYEMRDFERIIDGQERDEYEERRRMTLEVVEILETARRDAGIRFAGDER